MRCENSARYENSGLPITWPVCIRAEATKELTIEYMAKDDDTPASCEIFFLCDACARIIATDAGRHKGVIVQVTPYVEGSKSCPGSK